MAVATTHDTPLGEERDKDQGREKTRRLGRVGIQVPVRLWSGDESSIEGVTQDLSIGGMFVATTRALPVGSHVAVRLSILDGVDPIEIEAEVRWSRLAAAGEAGPAGLAGLGLAFIDPMVRAAFFVRVLLRSYEPSWI
ncbi:MAG TPA: PilZ domain-containing protein [Polyangia bacterium]|nr:PilZ domain-containing protein [Polyangia bacterium]